VQLLEEALTKRPDLDYATALTSLWLDKILLTNKKMSSPDQFVALRAGFPWTKFRDHSEFTHVAALIPFQQIPECGIFTLV